MKIEIAKFGDLLVSRPAGREAFLALSAYLTRDLPKDEPIALDFAGVKVMAPGWADEVVTKVAEQFPNTTLLNTENSSIEATLKTLRKYSGLKI